MHKIVAPIAATGGRRQNKRQPALRYQGGCLLFLCLWGSACRCQNTLSEIQCVPLAAGAVAFRPADTVNHARTVCAAIVDVHTCLFGTLLAAPAFGTGTLIEDSHKAHSMDRVKSLSCIPYLYKDNTLRLVCQEKNTTILGVVSVFRCVLTRYAVLLHQKNFPLPVVAGGFPRPLSVVLVI